MMKKTRYDTKEIECRFCHKRAKPILQRNMLKDNFYGQRYTGAEKKYLKVCPYCKAVIGFADKRNNQ